MNNPSTTKLTDSELAEIKLIRDKFQQKIFSLGQIQIQKKEAELNLKSILDEETKVWNEWKQIQNLEDELMNKILNVHGEGRIDLANGTFISEIEKK